MTGEFSFVAFYLLSALLLVGVTVAAVVEWKTRNPALLFWLALLLIYVIPSLSDPFNAYAFILEHVDGRQGWGLDLRHNPLLLRAQLFANGFVLCYLLMKAALYRSERRAAAASCPSRLEREIAALPRAAAMAGPTAALLVTGLALAVFSVVAAHGFGGILGSTYHSYYLETYTPAKALSDYLLIAFGGGVFVAWAQRRYGLLCLMVAVLLGHFGLSMARGVLIPAATPFVLYVLFQPWSRRKWVQLLAGGALAWAAVVLLLALRWEGGLANTLDALKSPRFYGEVAGHIRAGNGEARRRVGYYFFMQEGVRYEGFATGQSFRRLLLLPIPSAWARGLKPRPITERQYDKYYRLEGVERTKQSAGQLPTLAFGNAYANFAWAGMAVGAFWAAVFGFVSLAIKRAPPAARALYYCPLGSLLLLAARGSVYNAIARMFWCSLMIWLAFWLWSRMSSWARRVGPRPDTG